MIVFTTKINQLPDGRLDVHVIGKPDPQGSHATDMESAFAKVYGFGTQKLVDECLATLGDGTVEVVVPGTLITRKKE